MERFDTATSRLTIIRDDGIFLEVCRTEHPETERRRLIRLALTVDNKEFSAPEWQQSGDTLTLSTRLGSAAFRFDRDDLLRVRGRGRVSLRFEICNLRQFENGCPREDGSIEVAYNVLGKLLFVPLRGALWHNAMWVPAKAQADDFTIELLPSAESGEFAAAIHEYYSNGVRDSEYALFS